MPLQIIRQDITKIKADAIVNPTNERLCPSGGVDALIHAAAGEKLYEECKKIGTCPVGETRVTESYNLDCKYIIHTVGPVWQGGSFNEKTLLENCYKNCLKEAEKRNCESVAMPLISSGTYGYPKDKVLKVATDTITDFLFGSDMLVYLCVFDKSSYEISAKVFKDITSYIDDFYNDLPMQNSISSLSARKADSCRLVDCCYESAAVEFDNAGALPKGEGIDDFLVLEDSFTVKLLKLIDLKGMDDISCYKRANVSKQTWYKIMNDKNYKPNKKTVISFAIALKLTLEQAQGLLESVGFILSKSNLFDAIIIYCLSKGIYDVLEVDAILFKYDCETLFSKA